MCRITKFRISNTYNDTGEFVVGNHDSIHLLHRVLATSTIKHLDIRVGPIVSDIRITNWTFLSMLSKESSIIVLLLERLRNENENENEGEDIVVNNEAAGLVEHMNNDILKAAFWKTLTMNNTLQFLSTPPMKYGDVEYNLFIQSVPKLNIRGLQLNILDFTNDKRLFCHELLDALKQNFSLFYFHMSGGKFSSDSSIHETMIEKINWYCKRNVLMDKLLSSYYQEEKEEKCQLSCEYEELVPIKNAYEIVKPLPETLWSKFLYKLVEDCRDTQNQNHAIFRCLKHGMITTISKVDKVVEVVEVVKAIEVVEVVVEEVAAVVEEVEVVEDNEKDQEYKRAKQNE